MGEGLPEPSTQIVNMVAAGWDTAVSAVTSGLTSVTSLITGSPLLLLVVAIPFVGACIGLAKRLLRFGGRK